MSMAWNGVALDAEIDLLGALDQDAAQSDSTDGSPEAAVQLDQSGLDAGLDASETSAAPEFDWQFYRAAYPVPEDCSTPEAAFEHWRSVGQAAGYAGTEAEFYQQHGCSKADLPADFDCDGYLALNPDVAEHEAGNPYQATLHFLLYGQQENRPYRQSAAGEAELPPDFDWQFYLEFHEDLQHLTSRAEAEAHWRLLGNAEERCISLAQFYSRSGFKPADLPAEFDWQAYLDLNPDLADSFGTHKYRLIEHYLTLGKQEQRTYSYSAAAAQFILAERLMQQERWQAALEYYQRGIAQEPQSSAYLRLGDAMAHLGRWEEAVVAYEQAVALEPASYWACHQLGSALIHLEQWEPLAEVLRQAEVDKPEEMAAYRELRDRLMRLERWQEALVCYQKLADLQPESWLAQHELGDVLSRLKQWQDAVLAYEQALELNPKSFWSYNDLGQALIGLGLWRSAIERLDQAVALNPALPQTYYNLALAFAHLNKWQQAIAAHYRALLLEQQDDGPPETLARATSQTLAPLFLKQTPNRRVLDSAMQLLQIDAQPWQDVLTDYKRVPILYPELTQAIEQVGQSCLTMLAIVEGMRKAEKLVLPRSQTPLVSVVIPVYNKIDYTYRCLQSLAKQLNSELAIEIMVVNDCSTDETEAILQEVEGLILINNEVNSGFICSCNNGAAQAKGKYIYFLNNDTEIRSGSIEELVAVLETDETVGAVGSKLIYPNGQLQEAGGIIWQNADGWNYGRMQNPFDPQYNYLRPADYCSAASLMVRRWAFEELGGFERTFIPAYYEDTDLCFAIRNVLGLKVVCQPKSEIIHYEGISSGTSTASGVKRYQVINHAKFQQKWQTALAQHLPNRGADLVPQAARRLTGRTILIINPYPLCYDKESGARRLFELIKILKQLDYHVIFAPENGYKEEPYTSELQNLGVEVLYTQTGYGVPVREQIQERLPWVDVAWVCFPEVAQRYLPLFRQYPQIKVIYDTIDLHYLRLKRAWEMLPIPRDVQKAREWAEMRTLELELAKQADLTLTVTPVEQQILQEQAVRQVAVVPNIHQPYAGEQPGFAERTGLLFIGGYNHPPNVDAALWLCGTIMPYVWQQMPEITVTLLGSNPPEEVQRLAAVDQRISVPGYIPDVTPYFLSHRAFVAPLRYGAGMKGKVGQSLEYGLPLVSTQIGVEGMGLTDQVLVADTAEDFAYQILRLYADADLWQALAAKTFSGIEPFTAGAVQADLRRLIGGLIDQ